MLKSKDGLAYHIGATSRPPTSPAPTAAGSLSQSRSWPFISTHTRETGPSAVPIQVTHIDHGIVDLVKAETFLTNDFRVCGGLC